MADVISNQTSRYFCHQCVREVIPTLPNFICPHCHSGFIEELFNFSSDDSFSVPNINQLVQQLQPPVQVTTPNVQHTNVPPVSNTGNGLFHFFQGLLSRTNPAQSSPGHANINTPNVAASLSNNRPHIRPLQPNNPPYYYNYGRYTAYPPTRTARNPNPTLGSTTPAAAFDLQTLLEQILDWVGTDNAVFRLDPGGLLTYIEYDSNDPNRQTRGGTNSIFGNVRDYAWGPGALENIMEQLFNQIEGQGIPPASKDIITNLPNVVIDENDLKQELQCSICMEYFKIKEKVKALPCEHYFHNDCIVPWLSLHGTCPICRKPVEPTTQPVSNNLNHQHPHEVPTAYPTVPITNPPTPHTVNPNYGIIRNVIQNIPPLPAGSTTYSAVPLSDPSTQLPTIPFSGTRNNLVLDVANAPFQRYRYYIYPSQTSQTIQTRPNSNYPYIVSGRPPPLPMPHTPIPPLPNRLNSDNPYIVSQRPLGPLPPARPPPPPLQIPSPRAQQYSINGHDPVTINNTQANLDKDSAENVLKGKLVTGPLEDGAGLSSASANNATTNPPNIQSPGSSYSMRDINHTISPGISRPSVSSRTGSNHHRNHPNWFSSHWPFG
ncbi:unnamed protein product [Gordionus sp. m RMFG-2023]|uniref:uncharacterized protein LOC135925585 isoform X2 n=2 Tax=Gordionus sp. m RMFG-2023 TaxID=3053472 RepID=UPI0030E32B9F